MAADNPIRIHPNVKDETGNVYGKLTVIEYVGRKKWLCQCKCGATSIVTGKHLRNGNTSSCSTRCGITVHGHAINGARTVEYGCWADMLCRCSNSKHASFGNYGGRGVTVCERWKDFANFIADMGPRPSAKHSIDRKNNDGNYEPDNCRWATRPEQDNNKRTNRLVTIDGETKSLTQWANHFGINPITVHSRLGRGWDMHRALTTPSAGRTMRKMPV